IFSYGLMVPLVGFFLYTQYVYSHMSYFPNQNLTLYKRLSGWAARNCQNRPLDHIKRKPGRTRNWPLLAPGQLSGIRSYCRTSWFVQSVPKNRFGFTCGSMWFITRWNYVQVIIAN